MSKDDSVERQGSNLPDFEDGFEGGIITAQNILFALGRKLKELGGSASDLRLLTMFPELIEGVAQAILAKKLAIQKIREYPLIVNYDVDFRTYIHLAKFEPGCVDNALERIIFDIPQKGEVRMVARVEYPSNRSFRDELKKATKDSGFQPADAKALLAFVAKFPEIQLKHPLYAIGSEGIDPNSKRSMILCAESDENNRRELMAAPADVDFEPGDGILVVRKV